MTRNDDDDDDERYYFDDDQNISTFKQLSKVINFPHIKQHCIVIEVLDSWEFENISTSNHCILQPALHR